MMKNYCPGNYKLYALLMICFLGLASAGYSQTYTVTATPAAVTIYPGQQNVPVTVAVNSGDNDSDDFTGPVVVTMTGLPSGITVTPVTLTAGNTGTLYLSASPAAGQEGFSDTAPSRETNWTTQVNLVGAAGLTQVTSPLSLTVSISNPSFLPASSAVNLPIVKIDTSGVGIMNKTTDVPGTITITSPDGQTSYLPNSSDNDNTATFHLHGNSTLNMPKLAYHVKLNTSLDLLTAMGLTCPYIAKGKATCDKSKSYVLLANYDDKTLLRDWSASALANAIPYGGDYLDETAVPSSYTGTIPTPSGTSVNMPWAPHSLFVELYLNGVYEGNYQLIEEVKIDSHRVNITEMDDTNISGDALTGGYLMEIDDENGLDNVFDTPSGLPITVVDPDFDPNPPEQTKYISDYLDAADTAVFSSNFTDPTLGWRAYFDEASAVNFYIVNDVMGNVDGGSFYSSDYLYKDIDNPLIYMGPIWDFDISSGNTNYAPIVNPTVPWMQVRAHWYAQWFKDPGFNADVVKQWNALKNNGVFTTWLASIQQQAKTLDQSQANNFSRWPMLGVYVWPNAESVGSYDGEVAYFTNWLNLRIAYLDSIFNNKAQTSTALSSPSGTLRNGSPSILTAQVNGGSSLTGTVSFLANGSPLGTADLSGSSASLTTSNLPAGSVSLEAVYSGDNNNGLSVSSAVSVTVANPLIATATSLGSTSTNLNQSTSADLTVSVLGNSGTALPTGTVAFTANGNVLGSAPVSANGTASLTTLLPVQANSVQATYSGDANYQSSVSNPLSLNVVGSADFSFTPSSFNAGISKSVSSKTTLTLAPLYGFNSSVALSCSGQPAGISCSLSPTTVTFGSGAATSTLTLALSASKDQSSLLSLPLWSKLGGGFAVALLFWPFRRRRLRLLIALAAVLTAGLAVSACGTSQTIQTVPVTITASGGNITHTVTIKLSVTQ
jgi:hypothetical protein